jgi:predicted subunit of tRNA(5-methylaminomethyl-2-thiouridylate) methyltransferase
MKHNKFSQNQNQKPAGASETAAAADLNQNEIDFAPSPDEVARKAYFSYVNEGSLPGRHVQHWLEAEAELIAERKLTRVHGFHNQT